MQLAKFFCEEIGGSTYTSKNPSLETMSTMPNERKHRHVPMIANLDEEATESNENSLHQEENCVNIIKEEDCCDFSKKVKGTRNKTQQQQNSPGEIIHNTLETTEFNKGIADEIGDIDKDNSDVGKRCLINDEINQIETKTNEKEAYKDMELKSNFSEKDSQDSKKGNFNETTAEIRETSHSRGDEGMEVKEVVESAPYANANINQINAQQQRVFDAVSLYDIHETPATSYAIQNVDKEELKTDENEMESGRPSPNNNNVVERNLFALDTADGSASDPSYLKVVRADAKKTLTNCDTTTATTTTTNEVKTEKINDSEIGSLNEALFDQENAVQSLSSKNENSPKEKTWTTTADVGFRISETDRNLTTDEDGLDKKNFMDEKKIPPLDMYGNTFHPNMDSQEQGNRQQQHTAITGKVMADFDEHESKTKTDDYGPSLCSTEQTTQPPHQHAYTHMDLRQVNSNSAPSAQEQYHQDFQSHNQQASYEQMFEAHQQQQQQQEEHLFMQSQLYQMRAHHQPHHMAPTMPHMLQRHTTMLQDPLHEEHLMAYLHHQQQQSAMSSPTIGGDHPRRLQQQDVYQELVMDEFQEDGNPNAYKLSHLSPSTATRHENQDDGYETSAGDVLTPNSHSSSTHSGTPQLALTAPTAAVQQQTSVSSAHANQNAGLATPPKCQPDFHQQQQNHMHTTSQMEPIQEHSHSPPENFPHNTPPTNLNNDPYSYANESNVSPEKYSSQGINAMFSMQQHEQQQKNSQNHDQQSTCSKLDINHLLGSQVDVLAKAPQKRRGRKKKIPTDENLMASQSGGLNNISGCNDIGNQVEIGIPKAKERKKHDRFNGMSEEEVVKRTLPDHLCENLDIVIIGINPGLFAAYKGHHYAGPGNHFWKCLYLSGLTQEQMSADEDYKLMNYGIGFTNMVQRATKGSADLTRKEIKEGSRILLEKLQRFQPKIAVFNGKLIFEVFSGKKDFNFGRQPECVEGTSTYVWVMPSSSARCAQLPRAADKVPFYAALKKFRDYLNGLIPHIDEAECIFTEQRIRQMCEQEQLKNMAAQSDGNACSFGNVGTATQQEKQHAQRFTKMQEDGTIGGSPGPPPSYLMSSNLTGVPPTTTTEKKKRGRPKKMKFQEIIDPNTGQKIQIPANPGQQQQQQRIAGNGDYPNILNLSMMSSETPKKKRGRPKKVKTLTTDQIMLPSSTGIGAENSSIILPNPSSTKQQANNNSMSIAEQQQQQLSLYNNPNHLNIQPPLFGSGGHSVSPGSPTTSAQGPNNSSVYNNSNVGTSTSASTPPMNMVTAQKASPISQDEMKQHFVGPTPPPASPNICAVDFEPPSARNIEQQQEPRPIFLNTNMGGNNVVDSGGADSHYHSHHQWMSPTQHFNYQEQQQQPYQREQNLSMQLRQPQQQVLDNTQQQQRQQRQHSPHTPWGTSQRSIQYEANESNHHQHYLLNVAHQQQQQHQQHQHLLQHQSIQNATDVSTKSLSGLESLVDQIPTIAESEAAAAAAAAAVSAAAAAVENRLQVFQRSATPVGGGLGELQSEHYAANETAIGSNCSNDPTTANSRNSSSNGSNTPLYNLSNSVPTASSSPISNHYRVQAHNQQSTSSAASSPHSLGGHFAGNTSTGGNTGGNPTNYNLNSGSNDQNPPRVGTVASVNNSTTPVSSNTSTTNSNSISTSSSHHLFSNFSVSHLAASSVTSCNSNTNNNNNNNNNNNINSNDKSADWSPSGGSPYHHANFMTAAAALQLHTTASAASGVSSHSPTGGSHSPQMYIDHASIHHPHSHHHAHISPTHQHHVPVNQLYASAAQHHAGMTVSYGPPPAAAQHHMHNAAADYGAYASTAAAAAAHMLHVPSPNYTPYAYGTPPPPPPPASQSNYTSWNHHHHHTHHSPHTAPNSHHPHPHPLSMFERLKPADLGTYSSF